MRFFQYRIGTPLVLGLIMVLGGWVCWASWETQFMHTWDEQFHALVAKNMREHPLNQVLYAHPVTTAQSGNWPEAQIWLEKGPVPLWGIALSFKCFGTKVTALRVPSLVYFVLLIGVVFVYGRMLRDSRFGLVAAAFCAVSGALVWLASGGISSDHVEMAFVFWVSVGLLTALQWSRQRVWWRAALIGAFTGVAFLCKWYPALLVPAVWALHYWIDETDSAKTLSGFLTSALWILLGFAALAGPWLVVMFYRHPEEMQRVLFKFLNAYQHTVEEHKGPWHYYIVKMTALFGEWIWVVVLAVWVRMAKTHNRELWIEAIAIVAVVVLFSMAETKRQTYMLILALPCFVLNAHAALWLWGKRKQTRWAVAALVAMAGLTLRFTAERVKPMRQARSDQEMVGAFDQWAGGQISQNMVVFNHPEPIKLMFYRGVTAYGRMPTDEDLLNLQKENREGMIYTSPQSITSKIFTRSKATSKNPFRLFFETSKNQKTMNDNQESRLNMYDVVISYMNTNLATWTANPSITTIMTGLPPRISEARDIATATVSPSTGATLDKAAAKNNLATGLSEILGPAKAYAKSTNNNTLFSRVNYSRSALNALRDEDLPVTVQAIINTLSTLTAIPASGIIAADITTAQNLLTAYTDVNDAPRTIIVDRSTFNKLLEPKLDEIDSILRDQLDNQMLRYRTSNPAFYLGYLGARTIVGG